MCPGAHVQSRTIGRNLPGMRDVEPQKRDLIGVIEMIATLVVMLVLVAFVVWFFFFAHNPLVRV
jgi:hypothetical protein